METTETAAAAAAAMGAAEDRWMAAAMVDSGVVAELLVLLKRTRAAAAAAAPVRSAVVLPMRWGVRQPRSRTAPRCEAAAATASQRKEADSARNSPTTPLSWSGGGGGGASPSATADGFEESSLPANRSSGSARSKGIAQNDASCLAVNKPRKKKTFAELKDEENYLLNERTHLKKDIARLRATFTEQIARNKSLKKMKLDLNLLSGKGNVVTADDRDEATSGLHDKMEASTSDNPASSTSSERDVSKGHPSSSSSQYPEAVTKDSDGSFLLPDLNMIPSEDLYGLS